MRTRLKMAIDRVSYDHRGCDFGPGRNVRLKNQKKKFVLKSGKLPVDAVQNDPLKPQSDSTD